MRKGWVVVLGDWAFKQCRTVSQRRASWLKLHVLDSLPHISSSCTSVAVYCVKCHHLFLWCQFKINDAVHENRHGPVCPDVNIAFCNVKHIKDCPNFPWKSCWWICGKESGGEKLSKTYLYLWVPGVSYTSFCGSYTEYSMKAFFHLHCLRELLCFWLPERTTTAFLIHGTTSKTPRAESSVTSMQTRTKWA